MSRANGRCPRCGTLKPLKPCLACEALKRVEQEIRRETPRLAAVPGYFLTPQAEKVYGKGWPAWERRYKTAVQVLVHVDQQHGTVRED